jgi:hypothetical protein
MTDAEFLIIVGFVLLGIPAIVLVAVVLGEFWPYRPWRRIDPEIARLLLSLQQNESATEEDFGVVARALASKDVKLDSPEAQALREALDTHVSR